MAAPQPHRPADLDALIARLQKAGLPIRTAEIIDAALLLKALAARSRPPGPPQLKGYLRAVFCKSAAQQAEFDPIFDRWAKRLEAGAAAPEAELTLPSFAKVPAVPAEKGRVQWIWVSIAAAVIVVGSPYLVQFIDGTPVHEPIVPEVATSVRDPAEGAKDKVVRPAPVVKTPEVYGYFAEYRYYPEIQPWWIWSAFLLFAAMLLSFLRPSSWISGGLARHHANSTWLAGWSRQMRARKTVMGLSADTEDRLSRHQRGPATEIRRLERRAPLHLRRTVDATMRNFGLPALRYRDARLCPSYLVLVEAEHDDDFMMLWAERLAQHGIQIDLRRLAMIDGEPRIFLPGAKAPERGLPLSSLRNPAFGQRLIVVSEGQWMTDAQGERLAAAHAALFARWPQRVFFTPLEPARWSKREAAIELPERIGDAGFLLLPIDENALGAWSRLLVSGKLPTIDLESSPHFPPVIHKLGDAGMLDDSAPKQLGELIPELKRYLGPNGFFWLCCCAVPPMVHPQLTLLLGESFLRRSGATERDLPHYLARSYRLLLRLPWIRKNHMPLWSRLVLLASLAPEIQQEVRDAVEHELSAQRPDSAGNLELKLEPPPRAASPERRPVKHGGDVLYLGFLAGMSPDELALRMPNSWHNWISRLRPPKQSLSARLAAWLDRRRFVEGIRLLGWRRSAFWTVAGAVVVFAVLFALLLQPVPVRPEAQGDGVLTREAPAHLQMRHKQDVNAAAFSPDGQRIVTASDDGTAQFWDAATGEKLDGELRSGTAIKRVAYNADGTLVLTDDGDGLVRVWKIVDGMPPATPVHNELQSLYAAFSPDGKRLVSAGLDGNASVWDSATGVTGPILRHQAQVNHAVFSADGRWIATGSADGTARLWEASTGVELARFEHESPVVRVALSADREYLATSSRAGARIWRLYTRSSLTLALDCSEVSAVVFSPAGRTLATSCSSNGIAQLWNAANGAQIGRTLNHDSYVDDLAFNVDGTRLVTASADGTARVWSVATGEPLGPPLKHDDIVFSARFSPDGRRIITASADDTARMWSAIPAEPSMAPLRHAASVTWAIYSPDGSKIFTGGREPDARLWNAKTGEPLGESPSIPKGVRYAAFSADSRKLITLSNLGDAHVWATEDGLTDEIYVGDNVKRVAFSPINQLVATADMDGVVVIWDAHKGAREMLRIETRAGVNGLEFSPDEKALLTAGANDRATLWDANDGKAITNFMRHRSEVNSARFSTDGRRIVTASDDDTAIIWNAADGGALAQPLRSSNVVSGARFSPDGDTVLTVSGDNTVRVWNTSNGTPRGKPLVHERSVNCARFSPDGAWIATASADGTARIWSASTGDLVAAPIVHAASANCVDFSPDGRHIVVPVDRQFSGDLAMQKAPQPNAIASDDAVREAAAYVYAVPPNDAALIVRAASILDRWSLENRALFALAAVILIFFLAQFRAVQRWRGRGGTFAAGGGLPA